MFAAHRKASAASPARASGPLSHFQVVAISLCGLVNFLDGFDTHVMALTAPAIAAEWGLPHKGMTLVLAASLVGLAVGAGLFAPLGDRFGRRPALVWSMALIGVTTLAGAMATSIPQLILLRFLTGVGLGVSIANSAALISDYTPPAKRGAFVTLAYTVSALGSVLAGLSAPYLIEAFSWQGVFMAGGVLSLILAVGLWVWLPESLQFLIARKPGARVTARTLQKVWPDLTPAHLTVPSDAISRPSFWRLLDAAMLPRTLTLWVMLAFNLFVLYLIVSWLPILLIRTGWSQQQALYGTAAIPLGGIVGGLVIAFASARGWLLSAALAATWVLGGVALALPLALPSFTPDVGLAWGLLAVIGFSIAGGTFGLTALAACAYPVEVRATGVGWALVIGRIGAVAGPVAGGWVIGMEVSSVHLLGFLAVPLLFCALMSVFMRREWQTN